MTPAPAEGWLDRSRTPLPGGACEEKADVSRLPQALLDSSDEGSVH